MKYKFKRFIAMTTAIILAFSSNAFATPIGLANSTESVATDTLDKTNGTDYFADEDTNVWQNGSIVEEARVTVSKASEFEITIPKEVVLDGSTSRADYVINAKGDIAGDQILTIVPDSTFKMSEAGGKADITVNITQPNTFYKYQDLLNDGTNYTGHIETLLTAGKWSGSFYFNINFSEIELSETMIIYTTVGDDTQQSATYDSITELKSFTAGNEDLKTASLVNTTQTMTTMSVISVSEKSKQNMLPSNLSGLFKGCINLEIVNLTGFSIDKNTDVTEMFADCNKLTDENIIRLEMHKLVNLPCIRGHEYDSEVIEEPTCIEKGTTKYTCKYCEYTYNDKDISFSGHIYEHITEVSTCTKKGSEYDKCSVCDDIINRIELDLLEHELELTNTENYINYYKCKNCDYEKEEMNSSEYNFDYTGNIQEITLLPGEYKLETWGAQGGASTQGSALGGKGGYSNGIITLSEKTILHIYVGGSGKDSIGSNENSTWTGGWNGGGTAYNSGYGGGSGGGATDIRINSTSLYARVIVAAGGGGAGYKYSITPTGGYGGGLTGGDGATINDKYSAGRGASQKAGGSPDNSNASKYTSGTFGVGADSYGWSWGGAAGGGGWYGGGSGFHSAGGGSGYVYTSSTAVNYPSGCLLSSKYYLTNASTIAGNTSFTSPTGSTETGHSGNGYARITKLK